MRSTSLAIMLAFGFMFVGSAAFAQEQVPPSDKPSNPSKAEPAKPSTPDEGEETDTQAGKKPSASKPAIASPDETSKGDETSKVEPEEPVEPIEWQTICRDQLERRQLTLIQAMPANSCVVVAAAPANAKDYLGYQQAPDYLYLTGSRFAGGLFVAVKSEKSVSRSLYLPRRNPMTELWEGKRPTVPEARPQDFGNAALKGDEALVADFAEMVKSVRHLCFVGIDKSGLEKRGIKFEGPFEMVDGRSIVANLRVVKDEEELRLLQKAIDITTVSHRLAMQRVAVDRPEYQLQALIEMVFRHYGAKRPAFSSIVGSGPNSCVLHYSANDRVMRDSDLVVIDIGAKYKGYCADLTRTLPVNGKFSPRQREIYELVLAAQKAAFKVVKPGATLRQVHQAAAKVFQDAGYRKYFPHGTSHWLGLQTHDVTRVARDTKLKPGMVLTVEPGLYIFEEELGVRIEDVVVVTDSGYRCMSEGLPRTVEAVEAACRDKSFGQLNLPDLQNVKKNSKLEVK